MSLQQLPAHPNLKQYRKQAKELIRSWAAGEHGFDSWPKFAKQITAISAKVRGDARMTAALGR